MLNWCLLNLRTLECDLQSHVVRGVHDITSDAEQHVLWRSARTSTTISLVCHCSVCRPILRQSIVIVSIATYVHITQHHCRWSVPHVLQNNI